MHQTVKMREDILHNSDRVVGGFLIHRWGNPDPVRGCPYPAQLLLYTSRSKHVYVCACVRVCVCVSVLSSQQSKALLKVIYNGRFCLLSGLLPPLAYL